MKLISILHRLKTQFLAKLPSSEIYKNSFISISILILLASVIWISGPYLVWGHYAPLFQPDKRWYVISFLFLIWLLKFLMLDLDAPSPFQYKDIQTRKKLQQLQSRFQGAIQFLKDTTVTRHGKLTRLNELPWHLLIGPLNAGKTSLLANSSVNFILQRRFSDQENQRPDNQHPENCDWWVTRDASIIDVPGKYLSAQHFIKEQQKINIYPILWRFFLHLIKKQRGKNGINSIIIALPLPEIMKQGDLKKYHTLMRDLFQRLYELKKIFPYPIPCQLVITKCDLLPGFAEFFSEAGTDEIIQSWGITFPEPKNGQKAHDLFAERYDALIKRLNQQLIWRLHQERNPMTRPYIKDFPLQIERMKEYALEFIKKFSSTQFNFSLQGIYLTSALQENTEPESTILEDINTTQRSIQIFNEPLPSSRAYFIKQFVAHGLLNVPVNDITIIGKYHWQRNIALTTAISVIIVSAIILGKDFERGIKQSYSIQNELAHYQLTTQQFHDPDEHLMNTLKLLDTLQQTAKNKEFKWDLSYLLSFYSYKAQQKANLIYQQSLQMIFIPEIKNYLQDYLKNPINKNTDTIYAVLKAYLMLGNPSYFQSEFIINTMQQILPKSMRKAEITRLVDHLTLALSTLKINTPLNPDSIEQTRKFLTGIPSLKLSYIILKNNNNNNIENEINLGTNNPNSIFITRQIASEIPYMFTGQAFSTIFTHETLAAAQEALAGNWVLGNIPEGNKSPDVIASLAEQLRIVYVNNYIDVWESLLANINLFNPKDLAQTDAQITGLISSDSPMLQLLQTVHDNTYFEPIASASPKLQSLGALVDKNNNQSDSQMYQIFVGLQSLHQYIQTVLTAANEKKAAFEIISNRIKNQGSPDAITQLRLIAVRSPEPIKNWLDKIANNAWYFLMQEAGRYLDTSWQENVIRIYQTEIANRYPFGTNTEHDVALPKFTHFFGNPGVVVDFYNTYLRTLVDNSKPEWHWKQIDNTKLPFSEETLRQIQQAMRIHRSFFPNGDNKLYVQFTLQPYQVDKNIKTVKLTVNNKQILDEATSKIPHVLVWPSNNHSKLTSLQLITANQKVINKNFTGDWGWFKLINQSYENALSTKELLINFSMNEQPAKYVLFTGGQLNPFLSLNLRHFQLSEQLLEQKNIA